jgi:hypothetical protein
MVVVSGARKSLPPRIGAYDSIERWHVLNRDRGPRLGKSQILD